MKVFKDKEFVSSVVKLALPIALQNLIFSLLNIFDQIMVGALPQEIADFAMSSVLLVNQLIFIFQLLIFALANTTNIYLSQYYGKGDTKSIPSAVGFALVVGLAISVLANAFCFIFPHIAVSLFNPDPIIFDFAVQFLKVASLSFVPFAVSILFVTPLRSLRKMKLALTANIIALSLNALLNYCLMFGKLGMPELGLVGAAWGTVISRIVEMLIIVISVYVLKYPIIDKLKNMLSFAKGFVKGFAKLFIPVVANEIFWVLGTSVYLMVFAQLPDSENVLAAVNIAQTVDRLLGVVMIGLGIACSVVIGNVLGTKDLPKAKDYANKAIQLAFVVGITVCFLLFGLSFFAPKLFVNLTPLSQTYASDLLRIFAVGAIMRALNFTLLIGIIRAGGDSTFALVMEIVTIWFISVPLTLLLGLVFKLSVQTLYIVIFGEELIKVLFSMRRVKSGKWIKMLIE